MPTPTIKRMLNSGRRAFCTGSAFYSSGATSGTKALPTGSGAGDILIVAAATGFGAGSVTSPGNASAAYTTLANGNPGSQNMMFFARVLNAADITDGTFGYSGVATDSVFACAAYRGASAFALSTPEVSTTAGTTLTMGLISPLPTVRGLIFGALVDSGSAPSVLAYSGQQFVPRISGNGSSKQGYLEEALTQYVSAATVVSNMTTGNRTGVIIELT
jgi:hypothetical protein